MHPLEEHYLANGNVLNVVKALVASVRANLDLDWQTAQAIDLAGRDILEAVRTSVYPKVIDCPDPATGRTTIWPTWIRSVAPTSARSAASAI